jgi:hypothetical protein
VLSSERDSRPSIVGVSERCNGARDRRVVALVNEVYSDGCIGRAVLARRWEIAGASRRPEAAADSVDPSRAMLRFKVRSRQGPVQGASGAWIKRSVWRIVNKDRVRSGLRIQFEEVGLD